MIEKYSLTSQGVVWKYHVPNDIDDHPKKCQNISDLREEWSYYKSLIAELVDDSDFEVLSNSDGSEVKDHLGEITTWYVNKHKDNKIEFIQNNTYKNLNQVIGVGESNRFFNYLVRYYKLFFGEVVQILLVEDNILYSWNKNKDKVYTIKLK